MPSFLSESRLSTGNINLLYLIVTAYIWHVCHDLLQIIANCKADALYLAIGLDEIGLDSCADGSTAGEDYPDIHVLLFGAGSAVCEEIKTIKVAAAVLFHHQCLRLCQQHHANLRSCMQMQITGIIPFLHLPAKSAV